MVDDEVQVFCLHRLLIRQPLLQEIDKSPERHTRVDQVTPLQLFGYIKDDILHTIIIDLYLAGYTKAAITKASTDPINPYMNTL